jgi:hypothetical protein
VRKLIRRFWALIYRANWSQTEDDIQCRPPYMKLIEIRAVFWTCAWTVTDQWIRLTNHALLLCKDCIIKAFKANVVPLPTGMFCVKQPRDKIRVRDTLPQKQRPDPDVTRLAGGEHPSSSFYTPSLNSLAFPPLFIYIQYPTQLSLGLGGSPFHSCHSTPGTPLACSFRTRAPLTPLRSTPQLCG